MTENFIVLAFLFFKFRQCFLVIVNHTLAFEACKGLFSEMENSWSVLSSLLSFYVSFHVMVNSESVSVGVLIYRACSIYCVALIINMKCLPIGFDLMLTRPTLKSQTLTHSSYVCWWWMPQYFPIPRCDFSFVKLIVLSRIVRFKGYRKSLRFHPVSTIRQAANY